MGQLFQPGADRALRRLLLALAAVVVGGMVAGFGIVRSGWWWGVGEGAAQPLAFRHSLHVGDLGLDCRFCHATVDRAADAGMPTVTGCLGCHAEILAGTRAVEPLRTAAAFDAPIEWGRVNDLPAHARFHHGVHVQAGVGCETCHGRVDEMAEIVQTETLSMGWCLDCHRDPAPRLRPPEAVYEMGWTGEPHAAAVDALGLTDCSTCHR